MSTCIDIAQMRLVETNSGLSAHELEIDFVRFVPYGLGTKKLATCSIAIADEKLGLGGLYEQAEGSLVCMATNMLEATLQPLAGSPIRLEAEANERIVYTNHGEKGTSNVLSVPGDLKEVLFSKKQENGTLAVVYGRVAMIGEIKFLEHASDEEKYELLKFVMEKLFNVFQVDFILTHNLVFSYPDKVSYEYEEQLKEVEIQETKYLLGLLGFKESGESAMVIKKQKMSKVLVDDSVRVLQLQ